MSSQDFLFYSLGIGFLILIFFLCFNLLRLYQVLTSIKNLIDEIKSTAKGVKVLKNNLTSILEAFLKRKKK